MKNTYPNFIPAKKLIIVIFSHLLFLEMYGQDINYSQLHYTAMQVNPAYVGTSDFSSIIMNHRMNRIDLNNRFNYSQITATTSFYNKNTGFRSSGLGVSLFNDNFGALKQFVYQGISVAYSRQVQFTSNSSLGLGVMGGAFINKISPENFTTGSQWIPNRGFNSNLDIGENFDQLRVSYFNSAAGLNYIRSDEEGRNKFNAGVSLYNMNMPDASFMEGEDRRPFYYVAHVNYRWYSTTLFDISSDVLFTSISKVNQVNAGTVISYKLNEGSGSGVKKEGSVDLISRYVLDNYFVLGINFIQPNFIVGFSYDLGYKQGPRQSPVPGTTEFLVSLRKPLGKKRKAVLMDNEFAYPTAAQPFQEEAKKPLLQKEAVQEEVLARATDLQEKTQKEEEVVYRQLSHGNALQIFEDWDGNLDNAPGELIPIEKVFQFSFNGAGLNREAEVFLDKLYDELSADPRTKLIVLGHADSIGTETANFSVSRQRADAVLAYLLKKGFDSRRIKAMGKGDREPIAPNDSEMNRALNRRVEFILFKN
jgi:type IX secretion system PorP/SprF family membrane protein